MKDSGTTPRNRRFRRRGRAAALALAVVVGSRAVPVLVAWAATVVTIDCVTNYGTAQCQALTPMLLLGITMLLLIGRVHHGPEFARVKA